MKSKSSLNSKIKVNFTGNLSATQNLIPGAEQTFGFGFEFK